METIKISLLGDIMCEPLMLKAAKQKDGIYNFSGVFSNISNILSKSDYVIGNLETPLAGKESGFVHELFSFNAPDEFANAIKGTGINFVSTANNHCLDRGIDGLKRTVKVLDENCLAHSGTYEDPIYSNEPFITAVDDMKIAIITGTYGTNYSVHHQSLPSDGYVDLFHPDTDPIYITKKKGIKEKINSLIFKPFKAEQIAAVKKWLGMTYNVPRKDDYLNEESARPYFEKLERKINVARGKADFVIFYPHVGGQFNLKPGKFTEYTISQALKFGVDAIIASHPHIIQKARIVGNVPVFYSIGNFSMSPNSVYLLHENLPEYGLAVHLYILNKKIFKTTFSILKIIEEKGKMLIVNPVHLLWNASEKKEKVMLEADIRQLYKTITGFEIENNLIQQEYQLYSEV